MRSETRPTKRRRTHGGIHHDCPEERQTRASSRLADLGFDASWLKKEVPGLTFKDTDRKERAISEKYKVVEAATAIR
jgi:hypothetical protein